MHIKIIITEDNGDSVDYDAEDHDEALSIIAADYSAKLKEQEQTAKEMVEEMADLEVLKEEIK